MRHLYCLWKLIIPCLISQRKNDKFSYNPGSGYKTITVSPGVYEISQISSEIARLMKEQGDEPKNIVMDIQKHTLKSMIKLKNNCKVDFTIDIIH